MIFENKRQTYTFYKQHVEADGTFKTWSIFLNAPNILVQDAFLVLDHTQKYLVENKIVQFIKKFIPKDVFFVMADEDRDSEDRLYRISFHFFKIQESGNLLDFQFRMDFQLSRDDSFIVSLSHFITQDHWILRGLEQYFPTNRSVTELFLLNNTLGREPRNIGRPKILEYLGLYESKAIEGRKTQSGGIVRPRS